MNQQHKSATPNATDPTQQSSHHPDAGRLSSTFPLTDMPAWLALLLVALGVPRTVLADLDIVAPESGLLYYILALTPFAVWLGVALARRSRRPFMDFVIVGALYGLSLVVIHQVLWGVGPSLGHNPPANAVEFADHFAGGWRDLALRAYTSGIAMVIGIGSGLIAGLVALGANAWRSKRGLDAGPSHRCL
ncbi:hypothetical protein ACNAW0_28220 [Micromonospora sp. SL1-18]|uniref:hypothetical protein n=1 Tax=Micromonospora sp. SL1-18 TaxID=3399128 RepID=UPI003A4DC4E4